MRQFVEVFAAKKYVEDIYNSDQLFLFHIISVFYFIQFFHASLFHLEL